LYGTPITLFAEGTMKKILLCAFLLLYPAVMRAQAARPDAPASYLASAFSDWKTGSDGVARMNLVGDSTNATGLSTFRLRYPANYDSTKATVHFHMGTEHILVLKGTLMVGFGEQVDFASAKSYGAEGFVVIPSGRPHYHYARGETIIQVEVIGPSVTVAYPRIQRPIGAPPLPPPAVDSTHVRANGLPEWLVSPNGSARMNLAGGLSDGRPATTTELITYRTHRPTQRVPWDSVRMIYHYHFGTEHITVIRGTVYFAIGEKADKNTAKAYGPGSFIENPSGAKHYEFFPYESVTQVSAVGSPGAIPLDPATGQPQLVPPQR
jgi:quercetin dioxygenase-like cupin family protein